MLQRGAVRLCRLLARSCPSFSPHITPKPCLLLPVTNLTHTRLYSAAMSYGIIERGAPNTLDYRVFFTRDGNIISPFHDIPLEAGNNTFNMVVEVPRWTNAKMEIDTKAKMNPVKQDIKKGKLRFVHNCFPHHGYIWNYGALPQTWEDPGHTDTHTGEKGDNDPIDVCEIGFRVHPRGSVIQVKVLGVMALIDEGETDWKILAIDVNDPLAADLNDVEDIEKHMPGFLKATNEWFRIYKIPSGKPENQFAFNGEAKNKAFALEIIKQTHQQWQGLVNKTVDTQGLACENVSVENSPCRISAEDAKATMEAWDPVIEHAAQPGQGHPIDAEVDKWHYVKL